MPKRINLLNIDGQRSFCAVVPPAEQQVKHDGELCIPGAWDDMVRTANFVNKFGRNITDIQRTFDSHPGALHIAQPLWFRHAETGEQPPIFTTMYEKGGLMYGKLFNPGAGKTADLGEYRTVRQQFSKWTVNYLRKLASTGRYPHTIWPPHCKPGTPGWSTVEPLAAALYDWGRDNIAVVYDVTKGSNIFTEHFSAVRAEVPITGDVNEGGPDRADSTTHLNTDFIQSVNNADEIILTGEALSHCLANTVRDMADTFQDDSFIKKCVLFTDCSSNVPGFEQYGQDFIKQMAARGMRVTTSGDYLA